ncbi:eukaryotic membrane protein family-domain-containing protein [Massariosphaeria phaeospora]|uniref:Eukaryotic membrane protein family-domain-containing protein n=1 Tax=Massariosphaeria phaeospora TaxID=100035 RepID=A0A7C8IA85_9PLEO|nr:eukaryotic membrane protein family-domain-containing protein [Massariosphaeria phaeospora]
MNGADARFHSSLRLAEQLPTPADSPEPEDVAFPHERRNVDSSRSSLLQSGRIDERLDPSSGLSTSSSSRRPSVNDDALLSDTSEKARPPQIKRPGDDRRRSSVSERDKMLKLSPKQMHELTSEPTSIPIRTATPIPEDASEDEYFGEGTDANRSNKGLGVVLEPAVELNGIQEATKTKRSSSRSRGTTQEAVVGVKGSSSDSKNHRPTLSGRITSTPQLLRRKQSDYRSPGLPQLYEGEEKRFGKHVPPPLNLDHAKDKADAPLKVPPQDRYRDIPSPMPPIMPLPPLSIPTFLSLELSSDRPSPLYIYRPATSDFPYESSKIKYERLVNFLLLPPKLEGILGFGALACLDAWMHILTILPLRFLIAVGILVKWWGSVIIREIRDLASFVYNGLGRVWRRRRRGGAEAPTPLPSSSAEDELPSRSRRPSISAASSPNPSLRTGREQGKAAPTFQFPETKDNPSKRVRGSRYRHRRTKSTPSALLPSHKADILKGLLVISSCAVLMRFDASRMYHGIRGQSAIKLYVIYNALEVCDRLLSAVGQDVLECLFSRETLDRNPDGRSKVIRPFLMFVLALVYNVAHATALFYQVITLNVAVNSYSNALLTLLLSNQFVEIKGTVFKKFEKENLFQVTCADIVERFQLWLMLLIIAMRNIVELGGLSIGSSGLSWSSLAGGAGNATTTAPFTASSIMPLSFTIFPKWIAQVLNPFLLVLGSEMLVDWLKHAYITKFNQTKPEIYGKFLDVLAKDYYSDAFVDSNLTRRIGLPVLPLACLFIRSAIQTYHMFIATHMPLPFPSPATSLTTDSTSTTSPATTAALAHIDQLFRRALGRSSFGAGASAGSNPATLSLLSPTSWLPSFLNPRNFNLHAWTLDDAIAFTTMCIVFLAIYLFFLAFKLLLGMLLLTVARNRYKGMKERELVGVETGGKRIGGWGVVDVDEEKRRWIYSDDAEGLARLRERDEKARVKEERERGAGTGFGHVSRYAMVAKRIW